MLAGDSEPQPEESVEPEEPEEEPEEPEEEPLLRYQRLGADVTGILRDDHATCLACHPKFLALGTRAGVVAVLDLNGNEIRRFSPHSAAVNDLCIDRSGEFVGSCSEDGTVAVSSLYDGEASTHWYHRPVCAIALDPEYPTRRVFATGGLTGQLVLNAKGWFGAKDSTLHAGEGPVRAIDIAPNGSLIAWANDLGVKVYDAQHNKRVSFVDRPPGSPAAEAFRCHLRWETETELLIGWADSIKIGRRAWAPHAHRMRTAYPLHAHRMRTACPLHVHRPHVHGMCVHACCVRAARAPHLLCVHRTCSACTAPALRASHLLCVRPARAPRTRVPSDAVDAGRVRTRAVESEADGARRPAAVAASGSRYMEIVTLVQTDFYICGLGGVVLRVDDNGVAHRDLLLLAYVCEPQDEERYGAGGAPPGESQRPELRVLSRHNQAPPPFPLTLYSTAP